MAIIKRLLLISILGLGVSMTAQASSAASAALPDFNDIHATAAACVAGQLTDQHISNLVAVILKKHPTISKANIAQVLKELRNSILEIIAKAANKAQYFKLSQALHGLDINHIIDVMKQIEKIKQAANHLPKDAKNHINKALKAFNPHFAL